MSHHTAPLLTNLDYAEGYVRLGWHVLPVWSVDAHGQCRCGRPNDEKGHKPGKHPQHHLVPNGHHDATLDEATIREWWATDPDAGIGVSLSASGLLALDIDPKNGGWESLAAIEAEHGVLHSDCVAVTQGAGEHRLFRADSALSFPGKLGPGLDLKHHGYICVAPTLGPSGEYRWADGHSPLSKSRPAEPSPLPALIASRGRTPTSYSLTERGGVPVATAQTFDDLRSALKYVDADDYEQWVNVGMVLKPYGENGYKVWTEWSERSDKFDAAAQRRKWDRDIDTPHSITYRSIFRTALDSGWPGPDGSPSVTKSHPLTDFLSFDEMSNKPREFVLDNIMVAGIVIIAGYHGAGKTSQLVPLMCHAAHLCGHNTELQPTLRRCVIYIAEEPLQVFEVLDAMRALNLIPNDNAVITDWFKVVKAQRLQPAVITQITDIYRQQAHVNHHPTNGKSFTAMPVVVFDTANAVFELENENDNTEVGRAISELKREFVDIPIIIVTHTAKTAKSQNDRSRSMTARGASAWEADAHQVIYLTRDDADRRKLDIANAKHRFSTRVQAIEFNTIVSTVERPGILGDLEESTVIFGMPQISTAPPGVIFPQQATAIAHDLVITAVRHAEASKNNDLSVGVALTPLVDSTYRLAQSDVRAAKLTRRDITAAIKDLSDKNILTTCKTGSKAVFYRLSDTKSSEQAERGTL